jgi:hypothetical protein
MRISSRTTVPNAGQRACHPILTTSETWKNQLPTDNPPGQILETLTLASWDCRS